MSCFFKVGWETGDQPADDDIEDPGFARLALMDPTDTLPQGIFPIEMSNACDFLTNTNHYNYYLSHEDYGFHAGVDFSLPIGHNITASRSGVVTEIKRMCAAGAPCDQCPASVVEKPVGVTTGNLVGIEDDNFKYRCLHLDEVSDTLVIGQMVATGEYLGTLGCTGTGSPHLHFTMRLISGIEPHYQFFDVNAYPFLYSYACTSPPVCPHPAGHLDYCRDCGRCAEGEGDCDNDSECEDSLFCDQIVPGIDYCRNFECPHPIGHWDYCRVCGPCSAGQGDCDLDSECQSGMICAQAIESADVCCPHPVGHWDYCRDCGPCDLGQGDCDNDSECRGDLVCGQVAGASDSCEYESPP